MTWIFELLIIFNHLYREYIIINNIRIPKDIKVIIKWRHQGKEGENYSSSLNKKKIVNSAFRKTWSKYSNAVLLGLLVYFDIMARNPMLKFGIKRVCMLNHVQLFGTPWTVRKGKNLWKSAFEMRAPSPPPMITASYFHILVSSLLLSMGGANDLLLTSRMWHK